MRLILVLSLFLTTVASVAVTPGSGDFNPRLYPNPVRRALHVDLADDESVMNVYDMVGAKVYSKVLSGNAGQNTWDLVNSNGVEVVTGIYVVVIQSPAGKSSVQRIAILR